MDAGVTRKWEYTVVVTTDYGRLSRRVWASHREDAIDQVVRYCIAEGLAAAAVAVYC